MQSLKLHVVLEISITLMVVGATLSNN